jgi:hypothetical protein
MDDIVIGVSDKKKAIELLSTISDMLKSRGLSLNLAKTNIFSSEEGVYNFQIEQNEYIDSIENEYSDREPSSSEIKKIFKAFKEHMVKKDSKYWDKIAKRYITFFAKHKCDIFLSDISEIYIDSPNLRKHIIYYFENINYSEKSANIILTILKNISIFDDISLFMLTNLVTTWYIPITNEANIFLKEFEKQLVLFSK